jgi:ATP-binding cassette subfamily B protein
MGKFPHYKQLDAMDCGPTCLRMVAQYYGKSYSLDYLRQHSYITREGVSLLGISEAAENIGFRTKGARISFKQLCEEAPLPCIVHWNQNHFVVVYNIKKKNNLKNRITGTNNELKYFIQVSDPSHGLLTYSRDEFERNWLSTKRNNEEVGVALFLETTPDFYVKEQVKNNKLQFSYLLNYLRPYRNHIFQLILGMVVASLISLIFPFLTQAIVDQGISNSNLSFVVAVLIAQLVLTFGQTANNMIRGWIMLHVTTRVSISLISDFLIKLMKLPISFFDTKLIGDIMQRIGDHRRIQEFLTGSLINIFFAAITIVVYSFVMAFYHTGILIIFVVGSMLYIGWVIIFLNYRRELDYKRFQQNSNNQSNVVQLITGMQEIKLNHCERQKRWEWERIQASLFNVSVKGLILEQNQQAGATFINHTKNILISFWAAKLVIDGEMTLGMMIAMQYIIGQLNAPIEQFIGFTQESQDAKISLERLGEIHNKEDEEYPEDGRIREIPNNCAIQIKNLSFQYAGPHSTKVLKKLNLNIPANSVTAIVGMSGSGKSTLIKLLLRFYKPTKGKIHINESDLENFSPNEWRKKCGVVMQEGFIFSDTIANNISVSDEIPDNQKLNDAVNTANIKDFIEELPLRYNTKIGNDGHGVSTGQKQRILIARAVYKNPPFLFFDEATNALDANNELKIMENMDRFFKGRTVVVVAHRLSTVKKADQIVVLEKGRIVEIGRHIELVEKKGSYYNLVKNQLELEG